jgi:hypothetical protein
MPPKPEASAGVAQSCRSRLGSRQSIAHANDFDSFLRVLGSLRRAALYPTELRVLVVKDG